MGYVVFHMSKAKGNDSRMTAHIERSVEPKNADKNRTHLNREFIEFPDGVDNRTQAIQHRIKTAGIKRKVTKDQVRVIRINLSGTHEDMKGIEAEGRLDEWCRDSIDYLKREFGEKNVVSAVLHMDEKTPHIHASIVPIVEGERRKAKVERDNGKRKYKKKNTVRLCADDIMTRDNLERFQDTYAEAMAKYGLQRGIRGSEARHITTGEYYRNIFEQAENAKIERDLFEQQKIEKEQAIKELQRKEQEKAMCLADLQQKIGGKESELKEKEKQLREVKNEVVQVGFEKSVKEAGKGILEGVGWLMGNPKVKRLEVEIEGLNADIVSLEAEKGIVEKEAKASIVQKEKEITEKDKLINSQQSKLNKLFESIPVLKEYDFIMRLCERIKIPFDIVKQIFAGKKVSYSGELYSPEHKQNFNADGVVFSIGKSKGSKPLLAINDMYYVQWFKEQKNKFQQSIGINVKTKERNSRGIG
ncbi:MAG: MobV family relaxase [Dysgonomonas sp.]